MKCPVPTTVFKMRGQSRNSEGLRSFVPRGWAGQCAAKSQDRPAGVGEPAAALGLGGVMVPAPGLNYRPWFTARNPERRLGSLVMAVVPRHHDRRTPLFTPYRGQRGPSVGLMAWVSQGEGWVSGRIFRSFISVQEGKTK